MLTLLPPQPPTPNPSEAKESHSYFQKWLMYACYLNKWKNRFSQMCANVAQVYIKGTKGGEKRADL